MNKRRKFTSDSHIGNNPSSGSTQVNYSDIKGGWPSCTGNRSDDPKFHDPDHHDLHLKSQAGRWDPNLLPEPDFVNDPMGVNSPCIDEGDPEIQPYPFNELPPHSQIINMGAYGNTWQASKTPIPTPSIFDDNKSLALNDEQIDFFTAFNISPNPFSYSCQVSLTMDEDSYLDLKVYNMNGRQEFNLYSGNLTKGEHSFYWYGKNKEGQDLNNGIYMVVCTSKDEKDVKKVVLLR